VRVVRLWRGGPRALIPQLQLAGETHGDGEGLRLQAGGEELHFLGLHGCADAGKQGLKLVLVLNDQAHASAHHEVTERVGAQWRPKAGIEQLR
jgi:hypothetical protein